MSLRGRPLTIGAVAISPDGKLLAAGNLNGNVKARDATDGRELTVLEGHQDLVFAVRFSPDGQTLCTASKDETVRLWQVAAVR